jgi:murein DD-endopeptidase MepM/ murein hydrolase activator NlpD
MGLYAQGEEPISGETTLFDKIVDLLSPQRKAVSMPAITTNLQTLPLLQSAMAMTSEQAKGGGDVTIADESALIPEEGPSGAGADIVKPKNSTISVYVVREGDTLSGIAAMFDVSVNTIVWGNDLKRNAPLKIGQTLTILPVTGVRYTVKKGDTLASIAKALHGDSEEIIAFNGLESEVLAAGDQIIVPNGEIPAPAVSPRTSRAVAGGTSSSASQSAGYFMRPLVGGVRTQGVHGYNGVDIAAPVGTPFLASAAGEVIVARSSGWNGGYGQYIVVRHANGTQTLYAHASQIIVGVGQRVVQGQVIGYVGSTGRSTGAHLHFEIRGGPRNPF